MPDVLTLRDGLRDLTDRVHRFWRRPSDDRRLITATLMTSLVTGAGLLVNSGRDLAMAYVLGVSPVVDAFLVAVMLPALLVQVLAGSLVTAIMPALVRALDPATGRADTPTAAAAAPLIAGLLGWAVIGLAAAAGLYGGLGWALAAELGLPGVTGPGLFVLAAPLVLVQGLSVFIAGLANARHRFALAAAAPALRALGVIAILPAMTAAPDPRLLVLGMLAGALAELAVVVQAGRRLGLLVAPRWLAWDADCRAVLGQFAPAMASMMFMNGALFVDQAVAAALGPGNVTALSYGGKVVTLVIGLSALPLGAVVLPYFSRLAAGGVAALRRRLWLFCGGIVAVTVPLTALLCLLSPWLVTILFQRGAFQADDAVLVAQTQAAYLLQLPAYIVGIIGVRALSALGMNRVLIRIAAFNFMVNLVLDLLLARWLGLPGIALATSLMYSLALMPIFGPLIRRLRHQAQDPQGGTDQGAAG